MGQARETGLRRLARYTKGGNLTGARLHAARTVVQQQLAPRRWLISVPLQTIGDQVAAPCPRDTKVKVASLGTGLLAVVRVCGRPARDSICRGDAIILTALAGTDWIAAGVPAIRINAFGPLARFRRGFEVVVPVSWGEHPDVASTS